MNHGLGHPSDSVRLHGLVSTKVKLTTDTAHWFVTPFELERYGPCRLISRLGHCDRLAAAASDST